MPEDIPQRSEMFCFIRFFNGSSPKAFDHKVKKIQNSE